jgi:CAAX prenyl protease-like protein
MFGTSPSEKAYLGPFVVFMGLMVLGQLVHGIFEGQPFWAFAHPEYWVQPAQTLICGAMVARYWRRYDLQAPAGVVFAIFVGILSLVLWISPQAFFGAAPRLKGFDPAFFGSEGWPYALNVTFRFLRLVVAVPLVEEIFWRGFLLRWFVRDEFTSVPFGTFQWKSFSIVAVLFMLEHQPADYPAALLTGVLFNLVAIRTRSLSACVLTHAVTNLLLGLYILRTGQTGFW